MLDSITTIAILAMAYPEESPLRSDTALPAQVDSDSSSEYVYDDPPSEDDMDDDVPEGDLMPEDETVVVEEAEIRSIEKEVEDFEQEIEEDIYRPGEKLYDGNRQPAEYYRDRVANLDEDHYEDQVYAASTEATILRVRGQWQTYEYLVPSPSSSRRPDVSLILIFIPGQILYACFGIGLEGSDEGDHICPR